MMKLREMYRQLSRGKKLIILLMVLTAMDAVVVVGAQNVNDFNYIYMCIVAFSYLMIAYSDEGLKGAYRRNIIMKNRYIDILEKLNGLTDAANKVSGLPKVASATGQIYVDYDEVMKILEGGDIIER